jgi:hypothetical protein
MKSKRKPTTVEPPPSHDWRTTDQDEINRRRWRAETGSFRITNLDRRHPIFSNFRVESGSGLAYEIEVRHVQRRQFHCGCVDFRINGLGTCKHVEAVLLHLQARYRRLYETAAKGGSTRIDVTVDPHSGQLCAANGGGPLPRLLHRWFTPRGQFVDGEIEEALEELRRLATTRLPALRISRELDPWLETRQRAAERLELRRDYEQRVHRGEWPSHETLVPLYPYQREGMLHLAFNERALLADEMGLGKTIQAIAACALLHRLGKARRVLVVTPASLKTEWEEQIQRFTELPYQLVFGARYQRLKAYGNAPFFTIVNYEQMLADSLDVNHRLQPDVVILDEAQRIKNWSAKTSRAIKRLQSRYAFVLTGTPIENRIDELYSLMDFLDPMVLGPLFRFNREYYELDERGRPAGYRNLAQLHERIRPFMLRRRKADVETELPARTERTFFVPLSDEQKGEYIDHELIVARLAHAAKRRPLTQAEQDKLLRHLAMMRMVCDTNYILHPDQRACPKLRELEKILEECRDNPDVKVIVFSEWERMLELVRDLCRRLDIGFAWHTGSVPQRRRRAEINVFKSDPDCRVFLSTDSGATGLNLQNASVVINCDLPWNPAKLEQRIARAWRKHQTRPVTVIHLVSENTIEQRMLDTLSQKQALADGVLELRGDLDKIQLRSGRQAFLAKLQQLVDTGRAVTPSVTSPAPPALPADRSLGFAREAHRRVDSALVRCEERYPAEGSHSVLYVVVERDAPRWREHLATLHEEYFGPGRSDPLAPVRLEVIDRATDEALGRLVELGLVTPMTRAIRPLCPEASTATAPPPLSEDEKQQAAAARQLASRKLKMAHLLQQGDLVEEAYRPLNEAALALARALAIENRYPVPTELDDALLPPISVHWGAVLSPLRSFRANPGESVELLIRALESMPAPGAVLPEP